MPNPKPPTIKRISTSARTGGRKSESTALVPGRGSNLPGRSGPGAGIPQEAIAAPGNGLDEAGIIGIVAQRIPQSLHGRIQAMVEIDKGVGCPELTA
jgi:hypothetical protein